MVVVVVVCRCLPIMVLWYRVGWRDALAILPKAGVGVIPFVEVFATVYNCRHLW